MVLFLLTIIRKTQSIKTILVYFDVTYDKNDKYIFLRERFSISHWAIAYILCLNKARQAYSK